jgi:hypothetical protein
MPRPPKKIRDALKAVGEWDFEAPPPAFDPVEAFMAGVDDTVPMPGAFDAIVDFSEPPRGFFENGPYFGPIPGVVEDVFESEFPGAATFQQLGLDGPSVGNSLMEVAHAAAAVQVATTSNACGICEDVKEFAPDGISLPGFLSTYVETLGEFRGPDGREWQLVDSPSNVRALARACHQYSQGWTSQEVADKYWLPCHVHDMRTACYFAQSLCGFLSERGSPPPVEEMMGKVFSGVVPPAFYTFSSVLTRSEFAALELVFKGFVSEVDFLDRFSSPLGSRALGILGFEWDRPSVRDLGFDLRHASIIRRCLTTWRELRPTFEDALGVSFRKIRFLACGDNQQVCTVKSVPGGVAINCHYSFSKYSANYRACFGTPVVYSSVPQRMRALGRGSFKPYLVSVVRDHLGVSR